MAAIFLPPRFSAILSKKDVRDVTANELAGHDCVMHPAAISNDPMYAINRDTSIRHRAACQERRGAESTIR